MPQYLFIYIILYIIMIQNNNSRYYLGLVKSVLTKEQMQPCTSILLSTINDTDTIILDLSGNTSTRPGIRFLTSP
jgi:hypothetical protein